MTAHTHLKNDYKGQKVLHLLANSFSLVIVAELEVDHLEKQLQSADNKLIEIESEKETT